MQMPTIENAKGNKYEDLRLVRLGYFILDLAPRSGRLTLMYDATKSAPLKGETDRQPLKSSSIVQPKRA
jgi:hypothetical protein